MNSKKEGVGFYQAEFFKKSEGKCYWWEVKCSLWEHCKLNNPLSPSIHIQILQTDLHTFPLRISWENLIKHQGIFSFMIIFYILTTLSLDNVWTLLGENCCWSLLGHKVMYRNWKVEFTYSTPRSSWLSRGACWTSWTLKRVAKLKKHI